MSQSSHEWIDVIAREFGQLIRWPHHKVIQKNLPDCFKAAYPKITCIIDCSEIFIERATSLCSKVRHCFWLQSVPQELLYLFQSVRVDMHHINI